MLAQNINFELEQTLESVKQFVKTQAADLGALEQGPHTGAFDKFPDDAGSCCSWEWMV